MQTNVLLILMDQYNFINTNQAHIKGTIHYQHRNKSKRSIGVLGGGGGFYKNKHIQEVYGYRVTVLVDIYISPKQLPFLKFKNLHSSRTELIRSSFYVSGNTSPQQDDTK